MSPSESQLRAALQDGEGDAPDPSMVISHALRVRRDRRRRITSIAGGVAVVAVVGVGLTALVSSATNDGSAGSASMAKRDAIAGGAAMAPADSAVPSAQRSPHTAQSSGSAGSVPVAMTPAEAQSCPSTPARYLLPGGGGSGQFGSNGPLFASAVSGMKVCGYPSAASTQSQSAVYSAAAAGQLASALESAPTVRKTRGCPVSTEPVAGTIEILAVDANGKALHPVVITLACGSSQVTNGTAVRYLPSVPASLRRLTH